MRKVISLYTGVGGLDFGFEAAGFHTVAAVELDPTACRSLRMNRHWQVIEGDIHGISSDEILTVGNVRPGEVDVLIGGPPCQPFSKAGYWSSGDASRLDDPRSDTLAAYLRVLRDTQPRTFLMENVPGLAFSGKDEGLQHVLEGVRQVNKQASTNYQVHWQVLNASWFGVPQLRERVFLIGSRDGAPFRFPEPTHGPSRRDLREAAPYQPLRTTWDAIGDLEVDTDGEALDVRGKWADLLPSIPEGQNYLWHTPRGGGKPLFGWRTRYWSFLLKLSKSAPSWTIQAQPGPAIGPFHWRNRRLSAHELCRLQTFPEKLRFDCSRTHVQKLLGNAVPSLLAELLAREIGNQLLGQAPTRARLKLLPPRRGSCPPPEPVRQVPDKYLHLAAQHQAHPGEGKGNRARLRTDVQADLFS